jgi:23S rRNA (uracil1939-C5)-methyltransferase
MIKNDLLLEVEQQNLTIDALSHEGVGIASRPDGKKVFVLGALPGEVLTVKVLKRHRRYEEATVLDLKQISAKRVEPPCPHFGLCGGCQLQHLSHTDQVLFKQDTLKNVLMQISKLEFANTLWAAPLLSDHMGYRRKARIGVKWDAKKNSLYVGFRERASNKLAKLSVCPILYSAVGLRLEAIKSLISNLSIKDAIPQIEMAIGEERSVAMVFRHLRPFLPEDLELLKAFGLENQFKIYLQAGKPNSVHQLYPILTEPEDARNLLSYTIRIEDKDLRKDLRFDFHPLDFIQIHAGINQKMIQQALAWLALKNTETVIDLFCGLGNFTLALALKAQHVIGVEGEAKLIEKAEHNARQNQLSDKTDFYVANLFDTTLLDSSQVWIKSVDVLVIDPPRSGAKEVCERIEHWSPNKILYVSCSPASFARDAGILLNEKNYELTHIGIMDMFPHTHHIETMALFSLKVDKNKNKNKNLNTNIY